MNEITATPGVYQSAVGTIRKSVAALAQDAHIVANADSADFTDVLMALVDARQQVLYTKAGAKVISAANEMIGSLLDVRG